MMSYVQGAFQNVNVVLFCEKRAILLLFLLRKIKKEKICFMVS